MASGRLHHPLSNLGFQSQAGVSACGASPALWRGCLPRPAPLWAQRLGPWRCRSTGKVVLGTPHGPDRCPSRATSPAKANREMLLTVQPANTGARNSPGASCAPSN